LLVLGVFGKVIAIMTTVDTTSAVAARRQMAIGFRRPHASITTQSNAGVTAAMIVNGRPIDLIQMQPFGTRKMDSIFGVVSIDETHFTATFREHAPQKVFLIADNA
jgi:hypothetical protein